MTSETTMSETQNPTIERPAPRYEAPARRPLPERSPVLAALLSVVPGLGNVYNGLYLRGGTLFLVTVGIFFLATQEKEEGLALLIPAMLFSWLFNLFDAYRQATLINHGVSEDPALAQRRTVPAQAPGGLVLGLAVFLVGFYGLLSQFFDLDLSILIDYWYLGFMAFGGWLVARALGDKKQGSESELELPEATEIAEEVEP